MATGALMRLVGEKGLRACFSEVMEDNRKLARVSQITSFLFIASYSPFKIAYLVSAYCHPESFEKWNSFVKHACHKLVSYSHSYRSMNAVRK